MDEITNTDIAKVLGKCKRRVGMEDEEEKTIKNIGFNASTFTDPWKSQIFFYTGSKFCQRKHLHRKKTKRHY